ncbi:MAG TPA: ATP-binding protein [Terriglobia bacterium]|jgi:signal transduction histidine kinase
MLSKLLKPSRNTAAWRISVWTTLAFALGSAIAFGITYYVVSNTVRERSDAWLSGEAEVLSEVSNSTPQDALYDRIMEEVAELATHEMPDEYGPHSSHARSSAFFLQTGARGEAALWVGPEMKDSFLRAIQKTRLVPETPESLQIDGESTPFRVVAKNRDHGGTIYLGLSDNSALHLLNRLTAQFFMVWAGTVFLGFLISYASARGTLLRVEHISETVARIGSEDLSSRVPEGKYADEISRLSSTFNQMLDRIQASVGQLRTVTDSVAHDMKSPVTAIRGRLEVALSTSNDGPWRELVAESIDTLDRLSHLLNTMLDLAEAEAGALRLNRESLSLSALLRQQIDLYQPALAAHNHMIEADIQDDVFIKADVPLIHRLMSNLLENELAHLGDGCRIHMVLQRADQNAQLTIEDDGPGFPADIRNHVLERFVKGKHSRGHGLGLAFVNAVAQAHGGSVKVSDRQGRGAKITVSFPI